jgi:predicted alpha/beta-hydrolase family hydrolase
VPNTLLRQDATATRVALLLPGFGYSCDMPLLYYATLLLWNSGADVLRVEYAYHRRPEYRDLPASDQREWLLADAAAALDVVSQQSQYQQLVLIGKSLGTRAMGYLLTEKPPPQEVRAIWLTPLLRDPELRRQMRACAARSLTIIGTADAHYDPDYLRELSAETGIMVVTVEGADHSLDLEGDAVGSIRAMERVLGAIGAFLAGRGDSGGANANRRT